MAKKSESRTFHVSVVGLSVTEKEKGAVGIGKSCLCNRFMRPLADSYYTDHISVLSQSDFGGRVVNNDHFLYWGEVTKTSDEGMDFTFNVVEQTEFIDDSSFQPFKSGKTEPYIKRCASVKMQSAEKLMYICKNQLGVEHEFEQKLLPEGRINIDGFLCLFDVSVVPQRPIERQVEFTAHILSNLLKTKKPVVMVTTKNDEAKDEYIKEAERLVNRKEFKGNVLLVETSAHENVNVEAAFLTLAHMIDRTKGRPKIVPFSEATKARKEVIEVATEAYLNLIRSHVMDYKALWIPTCRRFANHPDYAHYVDLCGTEAAKKLFRIHIKQLKKDFVEQKQDKYLRSLRHILEEILPDLSSIADRSWPSCIRAIRRRDDFDTYFVEIPDRLPWKESDYLESNDERIPFDLLDSNEAEIVFRNHVNALRAEQRRQDLRRQFKQLLEDNAHVGPGKTLNEVAIFFLGRECFSILPEDDKQDVYEQYQRELKDRARREFLELLLERADLFAKFDHGEITNQDLDEINRNLQDEPRYKALNKLEEDRKVILLNHLGFIECPSRERCTFRDNCMENVIQRVLATKAHRPQSWSRNSQFLLDAEDNRLNLVILGADGLADTLAQEIRAQCVDDEYMLDGAMYSLDYRPIDGDVSLPYNSFRTAEFMPHGCFCVYYTLETLEYIRDSLEKTLLSNLEHQDRLPFQGLPIVIVLAFDPNVSEKGLMQLRDEGQQLADRLQCPFVDIPSSMMVDTDHRFHAEQINLAMHSLVDCIKHRSSFVNPWQIAESIEPDIRILMCFMCGDSFSLELPLAPLLNHQCCYVTSDKYPTITLETYLDESKRKVEVTVVSYHSASLVKDELYHGFILVYSAKRKASLAILSVFSSNIPPVPTKILAVTESGGANAFFSNEYSQGLLTDGNALADRIQASFMMTGPNFQQQTASYTPFFKDCWDKKPDTESAFVFSGDENSMVMEPNEKMMDRFSKRPPAVLPKPPKRMDSFGVTTKSSTSNSQSTEDSSEPVYDHPQFERSHSDSEPDRASSASPPFGDTSPYNTIHDSEVYSEIAPRDSEQRVRPSQVKSRRSMYAEKYRHSFPSASTTSSQKEDSTDTDSGAHASDHHELEGQPHYQFRKSKSMKLALKEEEEGTWASHAAAEGTTKKLQKASTLPSAGRQASPSATGWYDEGTLPRSHKDWAIDSPYESVGSGKRPSPPATKPKPSSKPKPLDMYKFAEVTQVLSRNMQQPSGGQQRYVKAPLAMPEPIEIPGDYAQVKDAVLGPENDYALVQDALPAGKLHRIRSTFRNKQAKGKGGTDSDSEFSSLERENKKDDIYARVNRRPTPHKKKHKPRHSASSIPPPVPPYTEERHLLMSEQLQKVRSNSPSEGSEGTGDELQNPRQQRRRSLKKNKKKAVESEDSSLVISPPWSDTDVQLASTSTYDETVYEPVTPRDPMGSPGRYDEGDDSADASYWKKKLRLKGAEKDPEKLRKKEEKRAKEDERRKIKEEEKKQKEQQKLQRKQQKKKEGKMSTPSQSSSTLEDHVQSEENPIPAFVEMCVNFIEEEGLNTEGIYRVPGNKAHVELLLDRCKEDPNVDIHTLDIPVNAVATALKGFFNDLHEPVISNMLYEELIDVQAGITDRSSRLLALRGILRKLPPANYEVLKYIATHIHKVAEHSATNSMDSKNLAICWWPTLLRPEFTSFEKMTMVTKLLEELIQVLIDQHGFFFYGENEV